MKNINNNFLLRKSDSSTQEATEQPANNELLSNSSRHKGTSLNVRVKYQTLTAQSTKWQTKSMRPMKSFSRKNLVKSYIAPTISSSSINDNE